MLRALILAVCLAASVAAQVRMSVDQLRAFIQSSKQLGHPDRRVAEYLRNIKLTERLDERTIEELQGLGAGNRTVAALRALAATSKGLPAAKAPAPKPVAKPLAPPTSVEQARVLSEARDYALEYSKSLPNFICTQVTRRYADPTGLEFWRLEDTVVAKLTFFEQREDYKVVLVNNRMVDTSMDRIGGATSTGEFGTLMRKLFEPGTQGAFEWERWGTLRGRRMHVYRYRVQQANSDWHVIYEKSMEVVPAYHGLVYVDRDTSAIMRVTLQAELPPSFPIQEASTVLDYDAADIAGNPYILPLKAVVRMRSGKLLTKNEVEFRFYKRFGAEATITYAPDPLPEEQTKEQPAEPAPPAPENQ